MQNPDNNYPADFNKAYQPPPYQPSTYQPTPQQPPMQNVVFAQQVGPDPMQMTCPSCRATIQTTTRFEPGFKAWIACLIMFLIPCVWCCSCCPFCMNECQNVAHSCPNCGAYLGTFQRSC